MDPRLLEQLAVPTPPYRTRSPKATLTMAEDVPPQASAVPEAPSSPYAKRDSEIAARMHERKVAEEKAKLEEHERKEWERGLGIAPEEKIAEATEQIDAAATVAKEKITSAPPIPEATPDISAKDDANKTEAVAKVEKAAAAGKQNITAARGKIKTFTEVASDALREIQQGRRQPYQPKPDLNAEREEFDSEMKKADLQLAGLEAAGRENTLTAQGLRDRIDVLEEQRAEITPREKRQPEKPAGPQVGDIVTQGKRQMKVLELAPDGHPSWLKDLEDEKLVLDTVVKEVKEREAAAPQPKEDILKGIEPERTPEQKAKDAATAAELRERGQKEVLTKSTEKSARSEGLSIGDIVVEGKTRAKVLEVNDKGRATRLETIPAEPTKPETPIVEEKQPSEVVSVPQKTPPGPGTLRPQLRADIAEAQGRGMGPGHGAGQKKEQKKSTRPQGDFDIEFKQPETREKSAGQRAQEALNAYRDAMEDKNTKPEMLAWAKGRYLQAQAEYDAWKKTHKEEAEVPVSVPPMPGSPGGPVSSMRQERATSPVISERAPTPRTSPEVRPVPVSRTERAPVIEEEPGQPEEEEAAEREPVRIEDLGERKGVGFLERWTTGLAAQFENAKAEVFTVLAKRQQDLLAARNKKVQEWEEKGKKRAEKGWIRMAASMVWDEQFAAYHKWRGRSIYTKWEKYNDGRVRRENNRNEILNQGAARIDRYLDSILERIDQYAILRDEHDDQLNDFHKKHQLLTDALGDAAGSEREELRDALDELESKMKEAASKKRDAERRWQRERKRGAVQLERKEALLNKAIRKSRPDTTPPKYDWLIQRITLPPERVPGPRKGAKKNQKLAA